MYMGISMFLTKKASFHGTSSGFVPISLAADNKEAIESLMEPMLLL